MAVLSRYAAFAVDARATPMADDVAHAAARAFVDWSAATIPGAARDVARILRESVDFSGGRGRVAIIGGGCSDPRTAALINGAASHTVEMDDIYREGVHHPGSPTVAAALAAAQQEDASGEKLLRAIAIGYEIGNNVAAAVQPEHYHYWHTTGTVGTIAAAAAAAEILELDKDRFAHALATATTCAAGLQQAFRKETMSKPLHAGNAATAGLTAAYAASRGLTGAVDVLDGPVGFGAAMSANVDWEAAANRLGLPWTVTQPTVKLYACCGHAFAAIDAALEIRRRLRQGSVIESIEIETYSAAVEVAGNPDPQTDFETRFSAPFAVATAIVRGTAGLDDFRAERLKDAEIRRLLSVTTMRSRASYDDVFPSSRRATVTVRTEDDVVVVERLTRKGDPDDPASDNDISEKFRVLTEPIMGTDGSARLLQQLWRVAELDRVDELFAEPAK